MKLAILTSHPIQYYSPLFRELARNMDVHVLFAHKATATNQADAGYGVPFEWDIDLTEGFAHSFLNNVSRHPNTSQRSGCDTPEIGDRLRGLAPDALLMTGWHLKSFQQGLWAARRQRIPVMVRGDSQLGLTTSPIRRAIKRVTYPVFLRQFDAALYVGTRSREYYEHYGYPDARLFFSPHCVDNAFFRSRATDAARNDLRGRLGVAPETKLVLFAGRLAPFKHAVDLVAAIAALRARGRSAELMIAGAGSELQRTKDAAASAQVPLHELGFVNQSELPSVYAAADALCLPSDGQETWGLVCNEALATGTPIVVSDRAGCAPDLCDGIVGHVFPFGDIARCSEKLEQALYTLAPDSAYTDLSERYGLAAAADGIRRAAEAMVRQDLQ